MSDPSQALTLYRPPSTEPSITQTILVVHPPDPKRPSLKIRLPPRPSPLALETTHIQLDDGESSPDIPLAKRPRLSVGSSAASLDQEVKCNPGVEEEGESELSDFGSPDLPSFGRDARRKALKKIDSTLAKMHQTGDRHTETGDASEPGAQAAALASAKTKAMVSVSAGSTPSAITGWSPMSTSPQIPFQPLQHPLLTQIPLLTPPPTANNAPTPPHSATFPVPVTSHHPPSGYVHGGQATSKTASSSSANSVTGNIQLHQNSLSSSTSSSGSEKHRHRRTIRDRLIPGKAFAFHEIRVHIHESLVGLRGAKIRHFFANTKVPLCKDPSRAHVIIVDSRLLTDYLPNHPLFNLKHLATGLTVLRSYVWMMRAIYTSLVPLDARDIPLFVNQDRSPMLICIGGPDGDPTVWHLGTLVETNGGCIVQPNACECVVSLTWPPDIEAFARMGVRQATRIMHASWVEETVRDAIPNAHYVPAPHPRPILTNHHTLAQRQNGTSEIVGNSTPNYPAGQVFAAPASLVPPGDGSRQTIPVFTGITESTRKLLLECLAEHDKEEGSRSFA